MKEEFSKLQELIKQDKVIVDVSKTYSGAAFGGKAGGFLFTIIVITVLASIVYFIFKSLFEYAVIIFIGLIVFWKLWGKLAFYYSYIRSIKNYDYFYSAYISGIIRLCVGEEGPIVSYPKPWESIFKYL